MSGIAGIVNLTGQAVESRLIHKMLDEMAYLGPDGREAWVSGQVALAHLQLQTTPEAMLEQQPISLRDGGYTIVCDGRIDNRDQLVQSLRHTAPVNTSTSDAELVLWAYIAWGAECPKRLIGDFAFAIWDAERHELFCARDPMGLRNFYYHLGGGQFVFASSARTVLENAGISRKLNDMMVGLYLLGRTNEAEQTLFESVFQIAPASYIVVGMDGIKKEVYWKPKPWEQIRYAAAEEYVEHFREVFFEAVRCRLRGISPIGITLSGGMDSTSITCSAASLIQSGAAPGTELHTLSSVFRNFPSADESKYISRVREAWNVQGSYVFADELWAFKPLRKTIFFSQPYPVPFQARHEAILERAQQSGIRVILTGEGGDEQLNPGFAFLFDMVRRLKLLRLIGELRFVTPRSRRAFYKAAIRGFLLPEIVKHIYRRVGKGNIPYWLEEDLLKFSGALEHPGISTDGLRFKDYYSKTIYVGLTGLPRQPYLPYVTELWSHHHIEARHPFLDLRVIEFLSRIPPYLKFSRGWTKHLLRQAMEGLLPDEVRLRPGKTAFTDVLAQGFREEKARIEALARDGYLVKQGWVKQHALESLLAHVLGGNISPGSRVFLAFVTFEDWMINSFVSNGSGTFRMPYQVVTGGQEDRR